MLKSILAIVLVVFVSIATTLSVVTWSKIATIEQKLSVVQKALTGVQEQAQTLAAEVAAAAHKQEAPSHAAETHWGYSGDMSPAKWGEKFPLCGSGKAQSPLNIVGPFESATAALKFDYKPTPLKVINNGHTLQVPVAPGSKLSVNGDSFELLQFHFHRPSEELIDGKSSDMVAHFVHKNAAGKLAVVGVLLKKGRENKVIRAIWEIAPAKEAPEVARGGAALNLPQMLPKGLAYYSYEGSLTTPPCTEGVTFYILKEAVELSSKQLGDFPFELNARPAMPLNGRKILAN